MPRILLIEDETAIGETIIYALSREGFSCDWHSLGRDGLNALDGADMVILDIGLPDISGIELCKQIRLRSDVPVIFLSARGDEIDRVVGLEIGADDYVVKPFSPRELVARIKAILKRGRMGVARDAGPDFILDDDRACVSYKGSPLDLTRYEFLLLRTILTRPEQVFSRAQLMDRVWTDAESSLERTVDAHVKTLRAKIRLLDPDCDPIETHRGMGYSFRWPKTAASTHSAC